MRLNKRGPTGARCRGRFAVPASPQLAKARSSAAIASLMPTRDAASCSEMNSGRGMTARLSRGQADVLGDRQRRVGALLELDRREEQLGVADILDAVQQVFARAVIEMARFAREMPAIDDAAVLEIVARRAVAVARPEIIEDMAVEGAARPGRQAQVPDAHALGLRHEHAADHA